MSFNLKREAAPIATLYLLSRERAMHDRFNLKREAAPIATGPMEYWPYTDIIRFNLKREAAPIATDYAMLARLGLARVSISNEKLLQLPPMHCPGIHCIQQWFQSQTRSCSNCHSDCLAPLLERRDGCICEADGFRSLKIRNCNPPKNSILFRGTLCKSLRSATGTFLFDCEAACLRFAPPPASRIFWL